MSDNKKSNVIYAYTLEQAIADGVFVELFKNRWDQLSGGKPIVATGHLYEEISLAGMLEIWNEFVKWRRDVMPTLPEEEQMFTIAMNNMKIWVIEDAAAFTLLFPEDY